MSKISLKLKVTLWYSIILLLLSFMVLYAIADLSQTALIKDIEDRLIYSVTDFGQVIKDNNEIALGIPENLFYANGIQMAVYNEEGLLIHGSNPFGIEKKIEFEDSFLKTVSVDNSTYYVFDRDVLLENNSRYWIRGMSNISDKTHILQVIVHSNFLFILLFVIVSALGGYVILCKAFTPVMKIRKTAEEISDSADLSNRIEIGLGDDEIHSLAKTFNNMLDKLEQSFNKEKQFTSDVSHELRTPISVILSECEYGIDCVDNVAELKEVLLSIDGQAKRMSKLVTELLTISRMDSNRLKFNIEETDISELLDFVCEEQVEIQTKDIKLVKDIEAGIIVNVDRLLLTRLFVNLISNAYQYSNNGTTIFVSLKSELGKMIFSIKDEGIGISEEDIPKIWDRFFQADSSRTEDRNGSSGLGLPMVKWIADIHKGKLEVKSELGKGSTFIFSM